MKKFSVSKKNSNRFYLKNFSDFNFKSKNKKVKLSQNILEEVMFQFCYPRLDSEVTKGVNHLLKSPFCIHPKTGIYFNHLKFEKKLFELVFNIKRQSLCSD